MLVQLYKMPHKLAVVQEYVKLALAPTLGLGSLYGILQSTGTENRPVYAIIGTILIAFFTYLGVRANANAKVQVVGIESKVKEIDVTESSDRAKTGIMLELFDRAVLETDKARQHFTEEIKEQRTAFFAKDKEAREHYEAKEKEWRDYFDKKEHEIRQVYHARNNEAQTVHSTCLIRLTKVEAQLKTLGIGITEDDELILPGSFDKRMNKNG